MNKRAFAVLFAVCLSSGALVADEKKSVVVEEQYVTLAGQPDKPVLMKVMSNGSIVAMFDDHFTHKLVAFVNEAGQIEMTCTDDHRLAEAIVAQPDTILRLRRGRAVERRQAERE